MLKKWVEAEAAVGPFVEPWLVQLRMTRAMFKTMSEAGFGGER